MAYLGLNPRVRQSGGQPARHGRITKAGAAHARGMLVEAAWSASKATGPLRAFYQVKPVSRPPFELKFLRTTPSHRLLTG